MEKRFKTWNQEKEDFKTELNELLAHESRGINQDDDYNREELVEWWRDNGEIHERIDSSICIYNYTLRLWSVDNYEYIERAFDELCCDFDDWHSVIQRGQYLYYSEVMEDAITEWIAEGEEGDDK